MRIMIEEDTKKDAGERDATMLPGVCTGEVEWVRGESKGGIEEGRRGVRDVMGYENI